jgi:pseudouridylate synthase
VIVSDVLAIHPAVAEALAAGRPVVALESTIVAHGLPFPHNLETARAVEAAVRAQGTMPATIAVLDGKLRVGLEADELERLAKARDALKVSRADLAYAIASGRIGATTVAATMIAAHRAGIAIFATGGIGGVHRGVEATLDISADLEELARTPVAVVCAGAKAILDLPRTLEYLETRGVTVIGYGTNDFPAFWCRASGLPAPLRLDTPAEIARLLATKRALGLDTGTVIANPIPPEHEIPWPEIAAHVDAALAEAIQRGIAGKAVTPFLLDRLVALTEGRSLAANKALILANARVAAQIAGAMVS